MISRNLPDQLKNKVLDHPKFTDAIHRSLSKIHYDRSLSFGFVVGVSGVGKSTAMRSLQGSLMAHVKTHPELNYGPPIMLSMHAPERKVFGWRDFYYESLVTALNEPAMHQKCNANRMLEEYLRTGEIRKYQARTIAELRQIFIRAVNDRRPAALFVDEVQELVKVKSREKAHDNLDVLKSLSDRIQVPVIGFGTSRAYEMLYQNEQTARRADVIHFERYVASSADARIFSEVLYAVKHALDVPLSKHLPSDTLYFYERTAGCVGVLLDWVKKAVAIGIGDKASVVSKKHLDETALGQEQMAALTKKIKDAQRILSKHQDFSPTSYLNEDPSLFGSIPPGNETDHMKKRKPGQRLPTQDPTGIRFEEALS